MPVTINGSTGIAGVDGSAGTPAVQGTDANTGIAFPAADTVSVATGGSERMRIDSSGNVGIGTSSPTAKLDVDGAIRARAIASEGGQIELLNADNSTVGAYFDVSNVADQTRWFSVRNNSSHLIGQLVGTGGIVAFYTAASERMRIDGSGRVTAPYQPAFFAGGNGGTITVSAGSNLPFNVLLTDFAGSSRNAGYNTSTYRYTAPVAGLYYFSLQFYLNPSSANNSITWWKNGAQLSFVDAAQAIYMSTNSSTTPSNICLSGNITLELAANDYVSTQVRTSFGSVVMYMGHSCFSGFLIG